VIFLDTNVISEAARPKPDAQVISWLSAQDPSLALSAVALAEIAFGIARTPEAERARRLSQFLEAVRARFAGRIFAFDEECAVIYGTLMASRSRSGRPMAVPDGMIAAIALRHRATLATRNESDFAEIGLAIINPWQTGKA
jgi:predicted nucleic acid-binding protein